MQADVARMVQDTLRPPSLWAATLTASSCVLLPSQCHAHEQYNLLAPGSIYAVPGRIRVIT